MKKNKKIFKATLAVIMFSTILTACANAVFIQGVGLQKQTVGATKQKQIGVVVNDKKVVLTDAFPYIESSRTMVPVRVVSENLGAKVNYNEASRSFTVEGKNIKDGKNVTVTGKIGDNKVLVNGKSSQLDTNPKVTLTTKNGRVYLPLRYFSEIFGYNVYYDGAAKIVYINSGEIDIPKEEVPDKPLDGMYTDYKTPLDAIKALPDLIEEITLNNSGDQANLILDGGNQIIVTEPIMDSDEGAVGVIIIQGWNIDGRSHAPVVKERNAETMRITKQLLNFYSKDGDKIYNEFNKQVNSKAGFTGKEIKTSDGRTFKFAYETMFLIRVY